jgi:hypothetical protein
MNHYELLLLKGGTASDFFDGYYRCVKRRKFLRASKILVTAFLTVVFIVGYYSTTAQTYIVTFFQNKLNALEEMQNEYEYASTNEVLNLAKLLRFASDDLMGENGSLKYAGLIYHAAELYDVDPLEVIALIAAESSCIPDSINEKTGDYGLGQVNWKYWGKPLGLSPQELLDPKINIVTTCHIYKHYGEDFSKYHSGHGIKSKAYLVNVQGILSSLRAHAKKLNIQ